MMDWNWFFSSLAQSVAALVGIFAAFIITKIINNQSEFSKKKVRLREILDLTLRHLDAIRNCSIEWYSEKRLEFAIDYLDSQLEKGEAKFPEQYYVEIRFPNFVPRQDVLQKITETIRFHTPRTSSSSNSLFITPSLETIRARAEDNRRLRDNVDAEGEKIDNLLLDVKQHIRVAKLHLSEIENNPESSNLISLSIISAFLLFILAVIYPLSFLPVNTNNEISLSISAFFVILFSLKGFMLSIATIIFLFIMVVFWMTNSTLKYDEKDVAELRFYTDLKNYSKYFEIMLSNQIQHKEWIEKFKAEQPESDSIAPESK